MITIKPDVNHKLFSLKYTKANSLLHAHSYDLPMVEIHRPFDQIGPLQCSNNDAAP